jgi:putative copper resistance protein D
MLAALAVARFVHYGALTYLFGALLFPFYAYADGAPGAGRGADRGRAGGLAAALALLSGVVLAMLTIAQMADDPSAATNPGLLWTTATTTSFGAVTVVRLVILAALAVVMLARPSQRRWAALILAAVALASFAGLGHGQVGESWKGPVHLAADAAHLLTAGLWIGALPPLLAADGAGEHQVIRRFSAVASVAVGVLVLTGVANTLFLIHAPADLVTGAWGWLLIAKLVLVLAMLSLASVNRWRVTPMLEGLSAAEGAALLRRNARLELGLSAGVLAIVAVMGLLSPTPM